MKSIIQSRQECYKTRSTVNIHEHHIFYGTSNRKNSEKYGLKVYLTGEYHNLSNKGVHFDKAFDTELKQVGQRTFESTYGSREDFIRIFGKNYLDD